MRTAPPRLHDDAAGVVRALRAGGHRAFFAGGAVRDALLGRPAEDVDVATSARPDEVEALFPRTVAVGRAFGVVEVLAGPHAVQVATFRRDLGYDDGRRPRGVVFADAAEDARRRDFTVNGLFLDPFSGEVLDFVDGRRDLQDRVLRAIGSPDERFAEDRLRMLRAVRLASVLGFRIAPATEAAIRRHAAAIAVVSPERIAQELNRLLLRSPRAGYGLRLLRRCGLLAPLLPEVEAMAGVLQPAEFHPEGDVFTHVAMMLDAMIHPTPTLAWAVLLHDAGKPDTARAADAGGGRIRFPGHAGAGAGTAGRVLERLRMPRRLVDAVTACVAGHMRFMDVPHMRAGRRRRLVGGRLFPVELELHRLDCLCSNGRLDTYRLLVSFVEDLRREPALPPPWVTGRDLLALGLAEGPAVGRWLARAYEAQLEGACPGREALLDWLRRRLAEVHDDSA